MVIDALPVPPVYSRLIRNPLCTLLYEDSSHSPNDWDNVWNKILAFFGLINVVYYLP